ncbi:MAG: beta-lactamase family protein [Gammaproteobacteria bacterium]|nr:beta-lactamase family protein [Gammaproteobacteria bacterium]MDH4255844.1 beta-lactamase family protein [Gammaproteobacteria bacterium]MDH5309302.1 beta-lactamase family protein [Gammaproteobacteria bacterium]
MARPSLRLATIALLAAALFAEFASGQGLQTVRPADVGLSPTRLEQVSATLQRYVDDGRLAGAVALVARHGRIAYLESFGLANVEAGTPMRHDSIFRIALQTKAIVSVGIMMLQ